ncbi:hypothetical protein CR152_01035 [Massilia violaceinigra]|uniref:Uncharacterized protein n=1 Tax=Massilia violaceinigra TaxID=2045208 RepID=A0A2D2DE41_9BURK|nr:hypothetical protein [Massilia violaceinigra]ATQ73247.1 hypothetical protein CR152_01035 [Massilia violaceinigra]
MATELAPKNLVSKFGITVSGGRDDLDWFEGARLNIDELGPVLVIKHGNNPLGLTALYVDADIDATFAESILIRYFNLTEGEVAWRVSVELGKPA